jgi:hypothetical protein
VRKTPTKCLAALRDAMREVNALRCEKNMIRSRPHFSFTSPLPEHVRDKERKRQHLAARLSWQQLRKEISINQERVRYGSDEIIMNLEAATGSRSLRPDA